MQPKKENARVIIVDANTYRKGFAVGLEELLSLINDSSGLFYHPADEDLLRRSGFSPGRTNQINLTGMFQWIAKNTQYRNLYLEFRSLSHKKTKRSTGK